jgi:hypothetical protein
MRFLFFKINSLYFIISSFFFAFVLAILAVRFIENPDILNYEVLLDACSIVDPCSVEPIFWIISDFVNFAGVGLIGLYLIYIYLLILFLWKSGGHVLGFRSNSAIIFPFVWFFSFGVVHGLIQIRFGLACAISLYVLSIPLSKFKSYFLSGFAFLTHFSTGLIFVSNLLYRKTLFSAAVFHFVTALILVSLKFGILSFFLPNFIESRLLVYFDEKVGTSLFVIWLALFMEVYLVVFVFLKKLPSAYLVAAIAFLPYLISPDNEIFIRLGVPFQYLLLLLFVKDFRHLSFYLLPVFLFFSYKVLGSMLYFFALFSI